MFVHTETTDDNLRNVESAIKASRHILLQGSVGTGKTLLVNHVAERHNAHTNMIHINVDDSFDSKDLLGKYSATDVPGSFEWIPGPLTVAVKEGRWVLMEDIDLASFDVFSVLLTLLEGDELFIADKNLRIKSHPNFKLVATQQIVASGSNFVTKKSSAIPSVELWTVCVVKALPHIEVYNVVREQFPTIPTQLVANVISVVFEGGSRPLSLREVLKWSARVSTSTPVGTTDFVSSTLRETFFHEAFDIFCARLPPSMEREQLVTQLAVACEVPAGIAESLVHHRKPVLHLSSDAAIVGRQRLGRRSGNECTRDSRVVFSETQHAMTLLERISGAVSYEEPVLLTGETGVGKTFIVQYLADIVGQELVVHNLNQQTDTGDFMGGWKPQDIGVMIRNLHDEFTTIFQLTFDPVKNQTFLAALSKAIGKRLFEVALRQFCKGFHSFQAKHNIEPLPSGLEEQWLRHKARVDEALTIVEQAKTSFMFKFEEGSLVRAWREGHWILLDEVNLATTEVLERVSSVLGNSASLFVTERGDTLAIPRHPNFRVFANMNPPTDVGKKDLPPALRSKFTEFFVSDPFSLTDLCTVVNDYIGFLSTDSKVPEVAAFFLECVSNARTTLCDLDGESQPPHFSLRTLTRALTYVRNATAMYGFPTALSDGLMLGFATPLQRKFHAIIETLIAKNIFRGKAPPPPTLPSINNSEQMIPYQHIWLERGEYEPYEDGRFILTVSVANHLKNLARAIFAKRPVLLEGPTSAGKSSMIEYLAHVTGHKFVRINNHESTEIQEYIGHYVSDEHGKLRFVDGILVDAVRNGHWVVLDELNLAPTEVLEALNRLLDDNCELFIADTQEVVKPHPQLRIFATQNPAGSYGGRKLLSRAFRNRFLEITVDDIPTDEIKEILKLRYNLAPAFAEKMVDVMKALQLRRQASHLFAGKHGYITPRDLFRWGDRAPSTYEELAFHGFLLLGERCRRAEERIVVKDVIESIMKVDISEERIYSPESWPYVAEHFAKIESGVLQQFKIVWTPSMKRLFTIVGICLSKKEPVLLVGETGSSKTTVCQLWAELLQLPLHIVNCHQHTEAADFLGGLRPVPPDKRDEGLFTWSDGPLVRCMKGGEIFVLDEISLAEDSVLERLNSVLEPSRSLTLAEKSTADVVRAADSFRVLATMNPGGDFGKKELSPALRNRFTEIYVRPIVEKREIQEIVTQKLSPSLTSFASHMADLLCASLNSNLHGGVAHLSIRDVLGWVHFMNAAEGTASNDLLFHNGLDAVILEGCTVGAGQSENTARILRETCEAISRRLVPVDLTQLVAPFWELSSAFPRPELPESKKHLFHFGAPTTSRNLSKLMRALVIPKAILLEGSPGVGKTTIVEALGVAMDKVVVRINLSDQTDIMDLFGTFLPCGSSDGDGPAFAWSDGILLRAVKAGHWVILDELNLANQSVLEGLNALLDHRSSVYIPELCAEIAASPGFRVFGCQNPLLEGGGRKGLPKSFLNRFTKVRVEPFSREDLLSITSVLCPEFSASQTAGMIDFVCALHYETTSRRSFGLRGSPWEFNLRDVLRWAKMLRSYSLVETPEACANTLFFQRFRNDDDRKAAQRLFEQTTGRTCPLTAPITFTIQGNAVYGDALPLASILDGERRTTQVPLLLPSQSEIVKGVLMCVHNNQFCLITGAAGSGKSKCLEVAATLCNSKLVTFSVTGSCDTVDLLGGFDQIEGKQGQFEWRDSVLVEAMIRGHWVVLDNANFCNASVLDRLNPLVEPNGRLSISEQGLVEGETRIVVPHPNFRLFATMDPKYGEISRAMRNRAIELYTMSIAIPSMEMSMISAVSVPELAQTTDARFQQLQKFHATFLRLAHLSDSRFPDRVSMIDSISAGAPNVYTLLKATLMVCLDDTDANFLLSVAHRYIRNRSSPAHIADQLSVTMNAIVSASSTGIPIATLLDAVQMDTVSLSSSLYHMRVNRSALHFVANASRESALMFFLSDQCHDIFRNEEIMQRRVAIAEDILKSTGRSANWVHSFVFHIGCHQEQFAQVLFTRVLLHFGPAHQALDVARTKEPTTDSSLVNTMTARVFESLAVLFAHSTSLDLLLKISRFGLPLYHLLTDESEPLDRHNFLPVVTNIMLLRKIIRRESSPEAISATSDLEELLTTLQRHLELGDIFQSATPLLLRGLPRVLTTTAGDRKALLVANEATAAHRLAAHNANPALHPLYTWVQHHHEIHLLLLLTSAASHTSDTQSTRIQHHIHSFLETFDDRLHLLTEMQKTTWTLARDASQEDLQSLLPFLATSCLAECQSADYMFPSSWHHLALSAINSVKGGTLSDFSSLSSATLRTAKELCDFFKDVLRPDDVLTALKATVRGEWQRISSAVFGAPQSLMANLGDNGRLSDAEVDFISNTLSASIQPNSGLLRLVPRMINIFSTLLEERVFEAAVGLFALQFELLVPLSPIDPMFKWCVKRQASEAQSVYFHELSNDFQRYEEATFRPFSRQLEVSRSAMAVVNSSFVRASEKYRKRPDPTGKTFVEFHRQSRAMSAAMMSQEKVQPLTTSVKRHRSEQGIQDTVASLGGWGTLVHQRCEELFHQFGGYEDFLYPLLASGFLAALSGKGLATKLQIEQPETLDATKLFSLHDTIRLIAFPAKANLAAPKTSFEDVEHLDVLMDYLHASVRAINDDPNVFTLTAPSTIHQLFSCYQSIHKAIVQLRADEDFADTMKYMYKEKLQVIEGDDEARLRKLKSMFPSYDADYADIDDVERTEDEEADLDTAAEDVTRKARHARLVFFGRNGSTMLQLLNAHTQAGQRWSSALKEAFAMPNVAELFSMRFDSLSKSLQYFRSAVPDCDLDLEQRLGAAFWVRSSLLSDAVSQLASKSIDEKVEAGFNVFVDPDPAEAVRCSKTLQNIIDMSTMLLRQFSDNPKLLRISKIGRRIAAFPVVSTPLMKIMTGCEVLLRECYEWERNASTEVSMIDHINALASAVLHWRRLELHCWKHIFIAKRNEIAGLALMPWFTLRDIADRACSGIAVENELFLYASQTMWGSKLGEFLPRLQLLQAFGLELISRGHMNVGNLLLQLRDFFSQFSCLVTDELDLKISPLEQDIADHCRIMRWEDSTYYAIRATTEKSHLKIARVLGRLEEALNQPFLALVQANEQKGEDDGAMGLAESTPDKPAKSLPSKKVPKPSKKSKKALVIEPIVEAAPPPSWCSPSIDAATNFFADGAQQILDNVEALQRPKVSQNQKTRALKMLFDAIDEAGLDHTSETRVADWPELFASERSMATVALSSSTDLSKPSQLYYRFARMVQRMREAQGSAHQDLSGAQVKRATGISESLFAVASSRATLLETLISSADAVSQMRKIIDARHCDTVDVSNVQRFHTVGATASHFAHQVLLLRSALDLSVISALESICAAAQHTQKWSRQFKTMVQLGIPLPQCELDEPLSHIAKIQGALELICQSDATRAVKISARDLLAEVTSVASVNVSSSQRASDSSSKRSRTEGQWSTSISSLLSDWDRVLAVDTISNPDITAPAQAAFGDISKLTQAASSCYAQTLNVLRYTQREKLAVSDHLLLQERIKLLMEQLSCVVASLIDNTSALNRFGMVISRLFTILFRKGFCKPEDEEEGEGEGEGEGTQDGTGMDDGQGEKDVTDEIQNEDQLMNMKDLEEQQEQQQDRNEDDEDNAADVETDFQAGKEEREQEDDDDDENDDDESDAELGDVDEQQAMDRKKSKKDRDDGEMDEDQGDDPETEIPEDDLAPEGDKEEEETGGFANKEEQIKDANGSDEEEDKGEKELIGDNDKFSDDGSNRSDGEDDDGSSTTTEGRDDDASETGSQPDESKPEDGDDEQNEENKEDENKPGQEQQATEDGGDEGDDISEHSDASYEEDVDENNFEGGQQDNREGEEKAQESERDRDKKAPQDAAGADDEAQGEEEKEDDAGRSWKRQEDNKDSKRKDNSNQNKSSSNPFSAIKEALKRHQRQLKQLDLSKNVKLKDDPSSKNEPNVDDARPPEVDEDIDEFEFSDEGQQQGLAATDAVQQVNEDQQEPDLPDPADEVGSDAEENAEDGSMRRKKRPQEIEEDNDDEGKDSEDKKKKKRSSSSKSKISRTDVNEEDEDLIPEIDDPTTSVDDKLSRGRRLWLEHEASVQGMAQQLCEQLRLILAPTVADKLQGDYKTGKRINIKKIIPYIASQYKKDRIWLRRTKPNKRTYQIVVALDDSLSMQMNSAGSMSLQTVALLSKAMQQLDVGEFGLISFGKNTNIVHPLAEAFSIESGPRAFSEITFEQTATNMRGFLETSLDYLDQEGNRMGGQIRSNTQQLQQIMFVISDGQITEDRRELRKHLARAEERRQFVVLIILDIKAAQQPDDSTAVAEPAEPVPKGKQSVAERMRLLKADREQRLKRGNQNKGSILDMQLVEFEGTKVVKKPYLDDFPFPYYLVVKDLQTLPQVVADAMRQWFEMINATH